MGNKKWQYWVIASVALLLASCSGSAKEQVTREVNMDKKLDGMEIRRIDTLRVTWIQDNVGMRMMERTLFPDASDSLMDSLGLQDGVPASVSTFVVETGGVRILFDTGNGKPDSRLLAGLDSLGIVPADIDYLYLTHFHGDHIGGMMNGDSIVFPKAQVYASRPEYEAWVNGMPADKNALQVKTTEAYKDRLHLFEFGDRLPGGVMAMNGVGHTPGHTVFRVGPLLVIGDLIHGAALQLAHPEICAIYDMDKEKAVESRKYFLQYAKDHNLTMAGMHLPAPAFIKP